MKCISVKQPWVECIFPTDELIGLYSRFQEFLPELPKNIENRTWKTPYRGRLLIHATKWSDFGYPYMWPDYDYPTGAIVGCVDLVDIVSHSDSAWYNNGCFGWVLENPCRFNNPIAYKGKLGLFDVPDNIL